MVAFDAGTPLPAPAPPVTQPLKIIFFLDKCSSAWEPNNEYNMFKSEEQSENTDCNSIGESENSDTSFFHNISISNKQNVTSCCENNVSVTKQQVRYKLLTSREL